MGGSGLLTTWDIEYVTDEEDPFGQNVFVCEPDGNCQWSAVSASDLDLAFGGDGEVGGQKEMVFTEDEVEGMVFCEEDLEDEEGFIFEEDEVGMIRLIPMAGTWTAHHAAGAFVCPGALNLEIPAGDIQTGTIDVLNDGDLLRGTGLSPDVAQLDLERLGSARFRATLPITTPQGAMTINFDVEFVSEDMALGMISGEMQTQGFQCTMTRPFLLLHESAESDVEPVDESAPDDDTAEVG